MPPGAPLELGSLPTIHPLVSILYSCGTSTIVRLSLDPPTMPSDTMVRSVIVDWVSRSGTGALQELTREIAWTDVPKAITEEAKKWKKTKNSHDITEEAAIGVMALLLHDLEGAEILEVLQQGSGGDYLLDIPGVPDMQAESSGIHTDPMGYLSTQRMKEKCEQVLTKCSTGFACVAAFSHSPSQDVRCKLHYVSRSNEAGGDSTKKNPPAKRSQVRKKQK